MSFVQNTASDGVAGVSTSSQFTNVLHLPDKDQLTFQNTQDTHSRLHQKKESLMDQSESYIFNHSSNESETEDHQFGRSPNKNKYANQEEALLNSSFMKYIPPPLPILPRMGFQDYEPPKCPLRNINFIQLKKFSVFPNQQADSMNAGYDLVSTSKRRRPTDDDTNGGSSMGMHGMSDGDMPTFVNNIVFCRDPKILEDKISCLNLKNLMQHENFLDIKSLVKSQMTILEGEENSSRETKKKKAKANQGQQKMVLEQESATYQLQDINDRTLLFESRFESGNLYLSQKVSENEYNLLMQNDINTQGHTQWFFFRVQNTRKNHSVKFNIINYSKTDSLFNYGMKVTLYSEKKATEKQVGWHRGCHTISYFANQIKKETPSIAKTYYTLTFSYDFEYDQDTVFFSYCFPYTYSDLVDDLIQIESDPLKNSYVSRKVLCKSLAGVNCEYLTVTSREKAENMNKRKCVVLSSRVHPGETVGSWMMRGVLKFITDPHNPEAKLLRENFIFKILPMLNPDGVINGNYRCSLAGCDLNRRWKTPSKIIHPTIYHTKKLVKESHAERGVLMFCDLHGHSRKQNVFMYGCNNPKVPEETRILPYIMSKISPFFSFEYSRFGVQKSKESTARGPFKGMHLSTDDLESLGRDLCRTILVYSDLYVPPDLDQLSNFLTNKSSPPKHIQDLDKKKFKEDQPLNSFKALLADELKENRDLMRKGEGDSSSGSDSAPSEDNLAPEEIIKIIPVVDKKTKNELQKQQKKKQQQQPTTKVVSSSKRPLKKTQSRQNLETQSTLKPDAKKPAEGNKKSSVKFPLIEEEKKQPVPSKDAPKEEESKEGTKKKAKVDMVDAWTQTERSDYSIIKSRMMSHQQYANTLMKQHENPLRLKAQKNYQQFARTPTYTFNPIGIGSSAGSQGAQENMFYKSEKKQPEARYGSMLNPSDIGKNFRSPQNMMRNQHDVNRSNIYNINYGTQESVNNASASQSHPMSIKAPDSNQATPAIKKQLNNSYFRSNKNEAQHSLSADQNIKKLTSNVLHSKNPEVKKSIDTTNLASSTQFVFQNALTTSHQPKHSMQMHSPQSNAMGSFVSPQGLLSGARHDLMFPVLKSKYQTVNPQMAAEVLSINNNQGVIGQTEKVLISEKKSTSNLNNQKHSSQSKRQNSGVKAFSKERQNSMKAKPGMVRRNSYRQLNHV